MKVIDAYSDIELYYKDKYHPSLYGSYLDALMNYATVYQEKILGIMYFSKSDDQKVEKKLQIIVKNVAFE